MAPLMRLKLAIVFFLLSFSASANKVVVFGTVKFSNGAVAANFPIKIQPDTTVCLVTKSILTNQNGAFETAMDCDKPVLKAIISYVDCEGHLVQVVKEVPASLQVEYNIILCAPLSCHAQFEATRSSTTNFNFKFNSSGSYPSGPVPDEIISRYWSWGDGSATDGNIENPTHLFLNAGTFNVCLKIVTHNGCFSYFCHDVVVANSNTTCKANYGWIKSTANNGAFHFTDSSHAIAGDSIVSRLWFWNDGTSTDGNITNPNHTFPKDSIYNVCLKITTREGCVSYSCQKITVGASHTECKANYGWRPATNNPSFFYFADSSKPAPGDSIISRLWFWGDGSSRDGNVFNPTHTFPHDSTYNVCLKITTREGCVSYSCQKITVGASHTECKANYGWRPATNNPSFFYFADSSKPAPGDSIISRLWFWGDGSSRDGNVFNPTHTFPHDSTYNVCLKITTREGCVSYSCQKITVGASHTECKANYGWRPATNNPSFFYFADSSKPAPGDSIISRLWFWGDGSSRDGNVFNPTHTFPHDSTYNVCLKITTREGCISYSCQKVIITRSYHNCEAAFRFEKITGETANPPKTYIKFFSGNSSGINNDDKIIGRRWTFGDGADLTSNDSNIVHSYLHGGTYTVCLYIKTGKGCYDSLCKEVIVPEPIHTTHCEAAFRFEKITGETANPPKTYIKFFSGNSSGINNDDKIIGRRWTFGDGTELTSNDSNIVHSYLHGGTYTVCLYIKTGKGCYDSLCKEVIVPEPINTTHCEAAFRFEKITGETTNPQKTYIKFFSGNSSGLNNDDKIIGRRWTFGDGTDLTSNDSNVVHSYLHAGTYTVCLYIKTGKGCYDSLCKEVNVPEPATTTAKCQASFEFENIGDGKLRFNSRASYSLNQGDSIIKRNWIFGDGSSLYGNSTAPVHAYSTAGTYTACLVIVTSSGCENRECRQVTVNGIMPSDSIDVSLEKCFPNPASTNLYAAIWSKHQNLAAELAIYDVYGILKWSKQIILPQGNSTWPVPTQMLLAGPYILKLTTQYGVQRLNFIKMY